MQGNPEKGVSKASEPHDQPPSQIPLVKQVALGRHQGEVIRDEEAFNKFHD